MRYVSSSSSLTCRNDIVHNHYLGTLFDRISLHLEGVRAILLLILFCNALSRQLALLPHGNKARADFPRQRRTKEKTATLQTDHDIDPMVWTKCVDELQFQGGDEILMEVMVAKEWHDVFEENAGAREIGILSQAIFQFYLKTGELGGTGGSGGGESSLGAIVTRLDALGGGRVCGGRVGSVGRRVGRGGSDVGSVVDGVIGSVLGGFGRVDDGLRGSTGGHGGGEKKRRRRRGEKGAERVARGASRNTSSVRPDAVGKQG